MEEENWFFVFIAAAVIFLAFGYFMGHNAEQNQVKLARMDSCTLRSSGGYTVLYSYENWVLLTSPEEFFGRCYSVQSIRGNSFKAGDRICTNTYNPGLAKYWDYCNKP